LIEDLERAKTRFREDKSKFKVRKNQNNCHTFSVSDVRSMVITPCQETAQCTRTMANNRMQDSPMKLGRRSRKQA
jgi:hypothetical protein